MNLQILLADKHTSFSGLAYFGIEAASQIAMTWFPQHKDKIDTTAHILKGAAVAYMGITAAGAKQVQVQQDKLSSEVKTAIETHDTSHLANPTATTTPPK